MPHDFLQTAVLLENVGVEYSVPRERIPTLKEFAIQRLWRGRTERHNFWALHEVNLEVRRGEVLGIVGANGAGKSTLLKVISQIIKPTTGRVRVWGQVTSLLELSAGFDMDLTGRENIYLNCALLGLSRSEIESRLDAIMDFAGVRDFIEAPLRTYSTGMAMRLGFAVATDLITDILILDEIFAVGDAEFQSKAYERLHNLRLAGKTIVFVSHTLELINTFCTRAIWLQHGRLNLIGETFAVTRAYAKAELV
jgi:ABC-type polysaccharide/polyol phosphate transport system ATPase subunit